MKIGDIVYYKDYDESTLQGVIINCIKLTKDWFTVDFGFKAFLVPSTELIIKTNRQLELF